MPTNRFTTLPVRLAIPSLGTRRIAAARRRFAYVPAVAGAVAIGAASLPTGAGAVPPGGATSQSNGAKVSIGASSVKAGGRIKVSGSGWKSKGSRTSKGAQVTIKLDDGIIVGVLPIKSKRFSGYVTIPKQVKKGRHWLRFLAAKPSTSIKSTSFKVTK